MESRIDDGYDEFHWSHDTSDVWGLHNEYYKWLSEEHHTTYKTVPTSQSPYVHYGWISRSIKRIGVQKKL